MGHNEKIFTFYPWPEMTDIINILIGANLHTMLNLASSASTKINCITRCCKSQIV